MNCCQYGAIVAVGLFLGLSADKLAAQSIGPSLADAQKALVEAGESADGMGVKLSCAVVDSRGALVALVRMDDASYFTADVAVGKARASATFGAPTSALENVRSLGVGEVIEGGAMLFVQGAVPIVQKGQLVGALGCSGASAQQDEDAANAGIASIP